MADDKRSDDEDDFEWEDEGTEAGGWERKPSDEEDRRHDDGSEPLAEPSDEDDDDLAEQEAGESARGTTKASTVPTRRTRGRGDSGGRLEERTEPLLRGLGVRNPRWAPCRPGPSLAIGVFVVVWCAVFFGMWALMGGIGHPARDHPRHRRRIRRGEVRSRQRRLAGARRLRAGPGRS